MENWFDEAVKLKTMLDSGDENAQILSQANILEKALQDLKEGLKPAADKGKDARSDSYVALAHAEIDRPAVITTKNLTKTYGSYNANDNVSITVKKGSIYGLIGRNGAGKTTWMKMVLGLTRPTSGTIDLNGKVNTIRKRIGYLIENPSFYDSLTAYQNLMYRAKLIELENPDKAIDEALEKVGILDKKNDRLKAFSLGQKQLLGIAAAIMGNPELLILDEPVNGLDPIVIVKIRNLLLDMNKRGVTIVISSHILGELQKLATCYGFILRGKLVRELSEEEVLRGDIDIEELFIKTAEGEPA